MGIVHALGLLLAAVLHLRNVTLYDVLETPHAQRCTPSGICIGARAGNSQ